MRFTFPPYECFSKEKAVMKNVAHVPQANFWARNHPTHPRIVQFLLVPAPPINPLKSKAAMINSPAMMPKGAR